MVVIANALRGSLQTLGELNLCACISSLGLSPQGIEAVIEDLTAKALQVRPALQKSRPFDPFANRLFVITGCPKNVNDQPLLRAG